MATYDPSAEVRQGGGGKEAKCEHPGMGTAATAASALAVAVAAGGCPAANDPLQGRKGLGTEQPDQQCGAGPSAAGEGCG